MSKRPSTYGAVKDRQFFTAPGFSGFFIKVGGVLYEVVQSHQRDMTALRLKESPKRIPKNRAVAGAPLCMLRPGLDRIPLQEEYIPGKKLGLSLGTCACGVLCKKPTSV